MKKGKKNEGNLTLKEILGKENDRLLNEGSLKRK
jgi:hypothetical protein